MERQLASIQKILDVQNIPDADKIEVSTIKGWKVVTRKGEFKPGDSCVFFEIDSILPKTTWSEFLVDKKNPDKPIRLKTIRLRKQLSQGLALPLSSFGDTLTNISDLVEGQDVTESLGVIKWEPYVPAELAGMVKGNFPGFLPKTDTERIQSNPAVIQEFKGKLVYGTKKADGTSGTFYWNPDQRPTDPFGVCSRNLDLKETEGNTYWKVARELGLQEKLSASGRLLAIQGEVCGMGIQKNRLGLSGVHLKAFDVYDIREGKYLSYDERVEICKAWGLETVDTVYVGEWKWETVEELLEHANALNYDNGHPCEGVVWRCCQDERSEVLNGRLAIKAISNRFLEKVGE